MRLEDFKKEPHRERRTLRANLRLYPSQMKFISDHGLSFQEICAKALTELGHVRPNPEDIESIAKQYAPRKSHSYGKVNKGNVPRQRRSARIRGKR